MTLLCLADSPVPARTSSPLVGQLAPCDPDDAAVEQDQQPTGRKKQRSPRVGSPRGLDLLLGAPEPGDRKHGASPEGTGVLDDLMDTDFATPPPAKRHACTEAVPLHAGSDTVGSASSKSSSVPTPVASEGTLAD